jgi:heterodisulfide reductase subunit C
MQSNESSGFIELNENSCNFRDQVESACNANMSLCWHCLMCSGGCPLAQDMDILPNRILRMIQFGLKEQVLKSSTIWLCVGCNTCSVECPNGVDIPLIMASLRRIAIDENVRIAEPGILAFHRAVLNSIYHNGRTHKLEIIMRYKMAVMDFFSDIDLGLKMFSKRKIELLPSRVKDKKTIKELIKMSGGLS